MKLVSLVIALLLVLQAAQALFLGPLLLALPLSPIVFTTGLIGLKVALAAKLLSLFFTGHYSAGLRAGSGIRGLEPTLLRSSGFNASNNSTSETWTESGVDEDLLGPAISTTTEFFDSTLKVPVATLQKILDVQKTVQKRDSPNYLSSSDPLDNVFNFLKEVDDDGCVSRLVCENSADANRFGKLGEAVVRYFGKQAPVPGGPGATLFAAATTGRLQGMKGCATTFSNCTADLPKIVGMAGLL